MEIDLRSLIPHGKDLESRFARFVPNRLYRFDQILRLYHLWIMLDLDLARIEKYFRFCDTFHCLEGSLDFGDTRGARELLAAQ